VLTSVDLSLSLARDEYRRQLAHYQLSLRQLAFRLYTEKRSLVVVFEGWDAAGKGGTIRRLTQRLDPRGYQVYSISRPEGDDRDHHYLWRFWRRLLPPEEKQLLVFDRSWYGRVLVERVEGFATEPDWRRAYREINDFEQQLSDTGMTVVKFWLHISRDEQARRFEQRSSTPHKRWKLTDEDWRNRERWDAYEEAVEEMLRRTSTLTAPWTVIPADDKWYARVATLRTLVERLSAEMGEPEAETAAAKTKKKSKGKKTKK